MADIAGTRLNDPRGAGECLKKIQTSGRHLLNLINEVLDMSKIESGQMRLAAEEMELAELVRNVLDVCGSLVKEKGHTLAVRADVAHERVRGDFGRLQQLFTNLLANAAKYTPAGGSISFSIDELPSLYTDVGLFECVIEDNGIGMSEDFVKHLFEPFKRADDPRICKVQHGPGPGHQPKHCAPDGRRHQGGKQAGRRQPLYCLVAVAPGKGDCRGCRGGL